MKVKIQVVIESEDGRVQDVEEVACLKRGSLTAAELGLNLAEAKEILHGVQQTLTTQQVHEYTAARLSCPGCGRKRPQKGHHPIVLRTLFGKLALNSVRLYQCDCQAVASQTFSPLAELLPERTAPELLYLEAKWCSLLSFGMTLDLLKEVLPIGEDLNVTTLRNHLHQVAERMEAELGEERAQFVEPVADQLESSAIPPPKPPLAVGLDGAYVHAVSRSDRRGGWFEVIVGKSINSADEGRYVALVHNYRRGRCSVRQAGWTPRRVADAGIPAEHSVKDVVKIGQAQRVRHGYKPDDHWVNVAENRTQYQSLEGCCWHPSRLF